MRDGLDGEPLAYTTIATMLRKMEQRALVTHAEEGRKFVYRARISSDDVTRSAAEQYVDRVFQGDLSAAVSHLLETREVDRGELAALERLIQKRRMGRRSQSHAD